MSFLTVLKYYWQFVKQYSWSQVILLLGFGLGSFAADGISPLIYKKIVDGVSSQPSMAMEELRFWLILLVALVVFYNIAFRAADYFMIKSQSKILQHLTDYSLEQLQRHSYNFFSNAFTGGLVAKTKRFVQAFEVLHDQFVFMVWMNGIALISYLVILWLQSWILGAIFLAWLMAYGFLTVFMIKWQTPKSLQSAAADSEATAHYSDIISNILTVKMFGFGGREKKNFAKTTANQEEKRRAAWMQQTFWNSTLQGVVIGVFSMALLWTSVELWNIGVITAGTIVLVQIYGIFTFMIVWNIGRSIVKAASAVADAAEMVKIFETESGVKDAVDPDKLEVKKGEIEFKDTDFSYNDGSPVFEKLNLAINPGEKVALVGHSGAGKSTVVKLLLRFMDVEKGEILIDGQNISSVTQDDLRSQIAYVPQEPLLFHRTLKENIAYGRPDATMEEIIEVSKRAHAHEFIEKLPDKYESLVGERGIKLSGGERQRIAIARAMLKNAPIVVLDEATSALDSISEAKIQEAFEELMKGKTTIVIAHRLSTIRKMDRIVVFDKGEVVETGTHDELLAKQGIYSELWASQVGGFITE